MAEDKAGTMRNGEVSTYTYRWVVVAVFALLNAVVQLNWIAFAPITGQAALFYGVSELKIGLLSMSFMIVYIIACLPASYLIDSLGIRMGIGIGAALTGIFGLLRGFYASNYTIVMVSQFGLALGQPFVLNGITAVGASWFPVEERATAAGIPVLAQFVGIIVAMAVTPLLTSGHGITGMLLFYGILSGVIALLFCVFMKEEPPTSPARERHSTYQNEHILKVPSSPLSPSEAAASVRYLNTRESSTRSCSIALSVDNQRGSVGEMNLTSGMSRFAASIVFEPLY